jgi:polar amino acid transport system permease protein
MLKNTSLASVISAQELLYNTQQVYSNNYAYFELLSVASLWYLAMTTIATWVQSRLEQRAEYRNTIPQRGGLFGFAIPGMHRG